MKWQIAVVALVTSMTLSTQSFGADLLDRMLGGSGCGCASSCCDAQVSCCDAGPSCGCDDPCGSSCCKKPLITINLPKIRPLFKINRCNSCNSCDSCAPACGCDMTASCGCDSCNSCNDCNTCGCDMNASCGCDPCGSSCCGGKRRLGLLDRIFSKRNCGGCTSGCGCEATCGVDACGCGCGMSTHSDAAPAPAPEGDSASLPPTPIVDPSAFVAPRGVYKISNR